MTRCLAPICVSLVFALAGCGDGHSPASPTRPAAPAPTPGPPPAPAAPAPLSGTMTVFSTLTKAGGYQYTVHIHVTEAAGVAESITSVDVAGDDGWGDYPLLGHFDAAAWGSSNVVPAHGTSISQPLVSVDAMPWMYYPSLRSTITFSDGTSVGSRTVAIDGVSPPIPEPPPGAKFKVSGVVWDEHHVPTGGVRVEVKDGANAGRTTTTHADGTYTLDALAIGLLAVDFSKAGYQTSSFSTVLKSNLSLSRELQLPR